MILNNNNNHNKNKKQPNVKRTNFYFHFEKCAHKYGMPVYLLLYAPVQTHKVWEIKKSHTHLPGIEWSKCATHTCIILEPMDDDQKKKKKRKQRQQHCKKIKKQTHQRHSHTAYTFISHISKPHTFNTHANTKSYKTKTKSHQTNRAQSRSVNVRKHARDHVARKNASPNNNRYQNLFYTSLIIRIPRPTATRKK